jgi:hypothetical protein
MKAAFEHFHSFWLYYENNYLNNAFILEEIKEITIALVVPSFYEYLILRHALLGLSIK